MVRYIVTYHGNRFEIPLVVNQIVKKGEKVCMRHVQKPIVENIENTSNDEIITDLKSDVELIDVQIQSQIEQQVHQRYGHQITIMYDIIEQHL